MNTNHSLSKPTPLISIVIPTLNRASMVLNALHSALAQPLQSIEVIVIDNGSQDNTWALLQQYTGKTNLHLIRHPHPLNICENWQRGLEVSTGQYVLILGDDDYLFPEWSKHVEAQIHAHSEPSFIAWNQITYIESNPLSGWKHLLVTQENFSHQIQRIEGHCLQNTYLRSSDHRQFPITPHPSLLLFHRKQINRIMKSFNTKWFEGLYPDYHAGVLCGELTTPGVFIDVPLVCIGGIEARYYCRNQSKMKRFLSDPSQQAIMTDINDGFGSWSPYIALNVVRQLIYSCKKLNLPLDIDLLLKKVMPETIENIWFCECLFGQGSHSPDLTLLAQKFGHTYINQLVHEVKRKMFRTRINRWINKGLGQRSNLQIRALLRKRNPRFTVHKKIKDICSATHFFLNQNHSSSSPMSSLNET